MASSDAWLMGRGGPGGALSWEGCSLETWRAVLLRKRPHILAQNALALVSMAAMGDYLRLSAVLDARVAFFHGKRRKNESSCGNHNGCISPTGQYTYSGNK